MSARDEAKAAAGKAKQEGTKYDPFPQYKDMDPKKIASAMKRLKDRYDAADKKAAELYREYDAIRKIYLPEVMEKNGLETVRYTGIGLVQLASDAYISQKDANKLAAWLKSKKHGSLIKPTINSSSLKSFIFELVKDGRPIPDDTMINFTPYSYAKITK